MTRRYPDRSRTRSALLLTALLLALGCDDSRPESEKTSATSTAQSTENRLLTDAEIALVESLSIGSLPPPPTSPSNRVADDHAAAELGHHLFFDPGLSRDGSVACASCHLADLYFTDGRATSRGLGQTSRNAPTVVAAAHSTWQFWDGRRDSLWGPGTCPHGDRRRDGEYADGGGWGTY